MQATLEGVFEVMDDSVDSVGVSESKHHLLYYNPCQWYIKYSGSIKKDSICNFRRKTWRSPDSLFEGKLNEIMWSLNSPIDYIVEIDESWDMWSDLRLRNLTPVLFKPDTDIHRNSVSTEGRATWNSFGNIRITSEIISKLKTAKFHLANWPCYLK